MINNELFEVFTAYYHQAVSLSVQHEFKKSSEAFDKAFEVLGEIRGECLKKYSGKKLTRIKSAEEVEYEMLKGIVLELRNKVGELSLEIEDIESDLGNFQVEYNSKVGKYYLDLDKLNYEIQILKMRLENQTMSDSEIERMIKEQLRDLKDQISEDEEQIQDDEKTLRNIAEKNRQIDDKSKKELRDLYRDLAKIYHPDKARTNDEKSYFENVMKEINDAYHNLNIEILRRIEAKAQVFIEIEQIGETLIQKIERLNIEKVKLNKLILNLETFKQNLYDSDTHKLMTKINSFPGSKFEYYTKLISDLNEKIKRKKIELEKLKSEALVLV